MVHSHKKLGVDTVRLYPPLTMSNSSSSSLSSSTDGLSFILEESSDDVEMLKYVPDDETDMKTIELLIKWRQATQANSASSSLQKTKKEEKIYYERSGRSS